MRCQKSFDPIVQHYSSSQPASSRRSSVLKDGVVLQHFSWPHKCFCGSNTQIGRFSFRGHRQESTCGFHKFSHRYLLNGMDLKLGIQEISKVGSHSSLDIYFLSDMYNNALLLASDERKSREGCHVGVTTKIGLKYTVCSAASFRFCIPYTLLLGTVPNSGFKAGNTC